MCSRIPTPRLLISHSSPRPSPALADSVSKHDQAQDCVQPMGWTSEMVAQHFRISREKQDEYALISHSRAAKAVEAQFFREEIIPLNINGKLINQDDTVRSGVSAESLTSLKSVFPEWGTGSTTAGNASGVGDGAGLIVMMSRRMAEREGVPILGKWIGCSVVGVEPRFMGIGPIVAIPKLLEKLNISKEDVDIYEVSTILPDSFPALILF